MAESAPSLLPLRAKKAMVCGGKAQILAWQSSPGHMKNEFEPPFGCGGEGVQLCADEQHRYAPFLRFSRYPALKTEVRS